MQGAKCRCLFFNYQYIIIQVCYTTHHEAVRHGMLLLGSSVTLPKSTLWQSASQEHFLVIVLLEIVLLVTLLLGSSIVLPKSTFWQSAPQEHLLVIVLLGIVLLVTLLLGSSIVLPKSTFW